jgi:hypothetical protein
MEDNQDMCAICMGPYPSTLKCEHLVHAQCIALWASAQKFKYHDSCPVCRKTFKQSSKEAEEAEALAVQLIQRKWRGIVVYNRYKGIKALISLRKNNLLRRVFNALVFDFRVNDIHTAREAGIKDDMTCSVYKDEMLRDFERPSKANKRRFYTFYTVTPNRYGFEYFRDSPHYYDFRSDYLMVPNLNRRIVKALIDHKFSIMIKGERFLPKCVLTKYRCRKCECSKWRSFADLLKCCNTSRSESNNIMCSKSTFVLKNHLHVHTNDTDYKYNKDYNKDIYSKDNFIKSDVDDEADNTKLRLPIVTKDFKGIFNKQKRYSSKPQ